MDSETGTGTSDSRIRLPGRVSDLPPPPRHRRARSTGPAEQRPRTETYTYYVEDPGRRSSRPASPHGPPQFEYDLPPPQEARYTIDEKYADPGHRHKRSRRYRREPSVPVANDPSSVDHQDAEDVLNDYLDGCSSARPQEQSYARPSAGPGRWTHSGMRPEARIYSGYDDEKYLPRRPEGTRDTRLWSRAARPADSSRSSENLETDLTLIVMRRGARFRSQPFTYKKHTRDAVFAQKLTAEYRLLKTWGMWSFAQKFFAYKTIAFVYFLQYRYAVQPHDKEKGKRDKGRWKITASVPITEAEDDKARDGFMYQLRNPIQDSRYRWTSRLDKLLELGACVDLEIVETFDAMMIYWVLLFMVFLSLGAALAYGFAMDKDFSTGFSIASWMVTAFGFFVAVVAAGEYFGLERPVSFQTRAGLEEGDEWSPGERYRH